MNDDEARNVLELFSNLNLNLRENDTLRASVDENVTNSDVEQWFDVENNDDVREASISDIADYMEQLAIATPARDIEDNECEGEINEITAPPPSLAQLQAMSVQFRNLHFYVTYRMQVLTFRELLMYLERQFAGLTQNATRQLLITEMFPRRS